MQSALLFLVKSLADLYILAFLLRFIFQLIRVDYDNPLVQTVVQVTNPLVVPARRLLPSVRGFDVPTLIVTVVLECVATLLLLSIVGYVPTVPQFFVFVVLRLLDLVIWFYVIILFIYVIASWFVQGYHPMLNVLSQIVAPLVRPVRRVLPPMGGIDLSPMLVTIVLIAVSRALPPPI